MNIGKFMMQFDVDLESNLVNGCPNRKTPLENKYDETKSLIRSYFSRCDCNKCRYKKNCIKQDFNEIYYEVKIDKNTFIKPSSDGSQRYIEQGYTEKEYIMKAMEEAETVERLRKEKEIDDERAINLLYAGSGHVLKKAKEFKSKELFKLSIYINMKIIKAPFNKFTGGAHVNIAESKRAIKMIDYPIDNPQSKDVYKDDEIEEFYLKALEIKPTNQLALHGIAIYYFQIEEYDKSVNYAKQMFDNKWIVDYIEVVTMAIRYYTQFKVNSEIDMLKMSKLQKLYEDLYLNYDEGDHLKVIIGITYAECAKYNNDYLLSYNILRELLKLDEKVFIERDKERIYENIAQLCYIDIYLNKPEEALKYYDEILKLYPCEEGMKIHGGNIAICYIGTNQYDKAIEILEKRVLLQPDNSDYFNLAKSYFYSNRYEKALENINKARYMFEDETSYLLASKINRKLGNISEAINLAEKALYFMENSKLDFMATNDKLITTSIMIGEDAGYKEVYKQLSICYVSGKKYEQAYTINKLALEKYPNYIQFKDNIELVEQFVDISNKNLIITSNIKKLEEEREKYKEQINSTRNWISELIKCQNNIIIDDFDKGSWNDFENEIEKIIKRMKLDASNSKVKYKDIYANLKEDFKLISEEALVFLSTAEYLYQYNKNNFIDFAPIVVEFSKVFEVELNNLIKTQKKKTLGQILADESIRNSMMFSAILDEIEVIKEIRNGSAHTGLSTKERVEDIRKKIYETNLLKEIIDLKKFI